MNSYLLPPTHVVVILIPFLITAVWALITMFFNNKNNRKSIDKLEKEMYYQERAIDTFKKEIDEKLDKYKTATDNKLGNISENIAETKTLVKLLVENKIK